MGGVVRIPLSYTPSKIEWDRIPTDPVPSKMLQVELLDNYSGFWNGVRSSSVGPTVKPVDMDSKSHSLQGFFDMSGEPRKKPGPTDSMKYWIVNRDPYFMVYYNPHITG